MDQVAILQKIHSWSLRLLVFLTPLWFLPFTQDALNSQKQALLIVLVLVVVATWLAKSISQGSLTIKIHWSQLVVFGLLAIALVSSIVSVWRYGSFWGWPLSVSDNFITILFFVLLYLAVSHSAQDSKELFNLFGLFSLSLVVAAFYAMLQLYHWYLLPFSFLKSANFNTVGSMNGIVIMLAIVLPFLLMNAAAHKTGMRWLAWVLSVVSIVIMVLVNLFSAWLVLIVGLLVLLTFAMRGMKKKTEFGYLSVLMALLVISVFFLIFRFSVPGAPASPLEVYPNQLSEINMFRSLPWQQLPFGTGPGTFVLDYTRYHGQGLNQTIFWGTRFVSGASELLDRLMTQGILGFIAIVATMASTLYIAVCALLRDKTDEFSWVVGLSLTACFASAVAASILYYADFTSSFLFWLLLGLLAAYALKSQKKISIAPPSVLSVVSSFTFLMVLILGAGLLFIMGQKYAAEVQYARASTDIAQNNVSGGIAKIISAISLNPSVDLYWRDLSQLYLTQLNQISNNTSLSDDQRKQQVQAALNNAIVSANQAVAVDSRNVENWNVRGFVYRNLIGIQGADQAAEQSYQTAMTLEPQSPYGLTELGRVYLTEAQTLANQKDTSNKATDDLNKALDSLNKAIALKPDYAPAHYLVALVYNQQGKSDDAIAKLQETQQVAPNDIGLAFQLGVIYYQKNQLDKAQSEFELCRTLNSDYANARFMLGLVYNKQGQEDKAVIEFNKVLALNPGNSQVTQILANLAAGKPALTGVQTTQPPVPENPSEIKSGTGATATGGTPSK